MKQLQHVHQLQLDWENPWHSSNVGLAIKTTPINILNETFLNHSMNLKPSGLSQRPSLCTICCLHNQTAIASDCIIHPSINPHCPGKSSRSHVSRARRPKSYQRPWQTSYSGTAEKSWQPLLVIHFGPMLTEALVRLASSVVCVQLFPSAQGQWFSNKVRRI